jgi:arylsulfatase B
MFAYIESDIRRQLAAVVYAMDESIGAVVEALHSKQMLENSIILFMSDNGGFHHSFGNQ